MCVIYQWPRCDASKSQCKLSAHVDTLLETEGRGQVVLASSGYINTGLKLEYKIVQRVLDFCQNWVKWVKCRTLFFFIRTGAEISNELNEGIGIKAHSWSTICTMRLASKNP